MARIVYYIHEALRGFLQAKLMTFVSIVTIAVSLAIVGMAALGVYNMRAILENRLRNIDLAVYLDDGFASDSGAVAGLVRELRGRPEVESVAYIDRAAAWERFVATYGSRMLEAVERNPLPASIELVLGARFRTAAQAQSLAAGMAGRRGVESVDYSRQSFERLRKVRTYVTGGALVLVAVCLLVLHFVVSNTVKLTIYARKDLVTAMRFVGATDRHIAIPFILEGMLQGTVGALISVAVLWSLQVFGRPFLAAQAPAGWFSLLVVMGVVSGWIGSASAVRRFLV